MTNFTGIEDFDAQLSTFMNKLASEVVDAASVAIDDAQDVLRKHIAQDVYKAYTPVVYDRRIKRPSNGTPLSDMKVYAHAIQPVPQSVNGRLVVTTRLYYNPEGGHRVKKWSSKSGNQKPGILNVDHNALIARIEKKDPAYNWGQDKVPARPFWQRFVDEMVDGGELEKSFVSAMSGKEKIVADGNVVEDSFDRDY